MRSRLLPFAAGLVRAWTRVYTHGLPSGERAARCAEIESDLWECEHDPDAPPGEWAAAQILARLLLGIPDDLAWRLDAGAAAYGAADGSPAADGMTTMPRRVSAFGLAATVHLAAIAAVVWVASGGTVASTSAGRVEPDRADVDHADSSLSKHLATFGRNSPSVVRVPTQAIPPPPPPPPPDRVVASLPHNRNSLSVVAQLQAFETISIKPAGSGAPRMPRMRMLPNGDLSASAVPVLMLVVYAYDVPANPSPRLSGVPAWRETYDIEAKAPANAVPADLPDSEKRLRLQGMLRGLLADRFKLVMRVEQKRMPVYALAVASGGPNLQKSPIAEKDCMLDTGGPEGCHSFIMGRGHPLTGRAVNMDDLAQYIENWTDLPVVNRTSLNGLFAVETEGWAPMRLPPPPPGGNPPGFVGFDGLPTIFTVLRTLGLELKRQDATVPVYTVEHIERPAGD